MTHGELYEPHDDFEALVAGISSEMGVLSENILNDEAETVSGRISVQYGIKEIIERYSDHLLAFDDVYSAEDEAYQYARGWLSEKINYDFNAIKKLEPGDTAMVSGVGAVLALDPNNADRAARVALKSHEEIWGAFVKLDVMVVPQVCISESTEDIPVNTLGLVMILKDVTMVDAVTTVTEQFYDDHHVAVPLQNPAFTFEKLVVS